ncbi:transposase [Ligilactobacillus agilis]|nr:transposase [Ligilactobacillus agilis]
MFAGYADLGYNATKKQHFYGFKVHMVATPGGLILNYVVTPASVSDVKVALTVTQDCPCSNILADVGYISNDFLPLVKRNIE